jgi:hypothetical protein
MITFLLYAVASFYYIWSNLERASHALLTIASNVPYLGTLPLLKSVDTTVRQVILPNKALCAASATVVSLLTYPAISAVNAVLQAFVYWLTLLALAYLSISQHEQVFKFVQDHVKCAVALLKEHAPKQFDRLVGARLASASVSSPITPSTTTSSTTSSSEQDDDFSEDDEADQVADDEENGPVAAAAVPARVATRAKSTK